MTSSNSVQSTTSQFSPAWLNVDSDFIYVKLIECILIDSSVIQFNSAECNLTHCILIRYGSIEFRLSQFNLIQLIFVAAGLIEIDWRRCISREI